MAKEGNAIKMGYNRNKPGGNNRKGTNQYTCSLERMNLAREMRHVQKMHYSKIAAELGITTATAYRWCNEKNTSMYKARARFLYKRWNLCADNRANPIDVAARLAEIPVDNRTPSEVICGEPLQGRRAIDRQGQGLNHNGKAHITLPTVQSRSTMHFD